MDKAKIPNILTIARIVLIPVLILSFYVPWKITNLIVAFWFMLASITDFFDGYLARLYKVQSKFGQCFDPIADKLIVIVALVMIISCNDNIFILIPSLIIMCREILVSGLREFLGSLNVGMPVTKLAKYKTAFQMFAITGLLLASKDSTYTYEIKFYAYSLKETGTDAICRLCAWEGAAEEKANMLRFGENGYEGNSLQLVSPAGNIVSNTLFEPGRWYMLSLVYDGSTMTMYVDGEPEERKGTGDGSTVFQRFEMGMSWQGYPAMQLFSGRIAEMRLWDRALSVTEMKEGVCNVPADSEGLRAYWKFNEGEGHIFHDATGNGYDMDWSDTYRDAGSGSLSPFDKGAIAEGQWTSADDPINVCRN